jgi:hypothetical protein
MISAVLEPVSARSWAVAGATTISVFTVNGVVLDAYAKNTNHLLTRRAGGHRCDQRERTVRVGGCRPERDTGRRQHDRHHGVRTVTVTGDRYRLSLDMASSLDYRTRPAIR